MSYVIIDLEWNASYSKLLDKFVNEIIEIGAVKVDETLKEIDSFTMLVSPQISKKLTGKVRELTKITNEELEAKGVGFMTAMGMFTEFADGDTVMSWSDSDLHALTENYSYYTGSVKLPFLKSYCNLQDYCQSCLETGGPSNQLGLGACAELLGLEYHEENQHRALADVYVTLDCLRKLYGEYPLDPFIKKADCSRFYDWLLFKNHFITDINSPEVDKTQMFFNCPLCGRRMGKKTKWKLHNKSFTADFACKLCKKRFAGRISFKKKFDGVTVSKKLNEKNSETNKVQ